MQSNRGHRRGEARQGSRTPFLRNPLLLPQPNIPHRCVSAKELGLMMAERPRLRGLMMAETQKTGSWTWTNASGQK